MYIFSVSLCVSVNHMHKKVWCTEDNVEKLIPWRDIQEYAQRQYQKKQTAIHSLPTFVYDIYS